jgi:hypothetical protein
MTDSPEVPHPHPHGKGIGGFLSQQTAGLPNWAWLLVIATGIAAAVVVPKLLNPGGGGSSSPTSAGSDTGLGLAIDPTTGLPYAVQGLVPSGANTASSPDMSSVPPVPQQQNPPQATTKSYTTIKVGSLESSPRNVNGHTLSTIPKGASVQLLNGPPIPDPAGGSKHYYPVSYNGQSGYVGSDVINVGAGSTGPDRPPMPWPYPHLYHRYYGGI